MKSRDVIIALVGGVLLFFLYTNVKKNNPLSSAGNSINKFFTDTGNKVNKFFKDTETMAQNIAENAQNTTEQALGSTQKAAVSWWDRVQAFFSNIQQDITLAFNNSHAPSVTNDNLLFGNVKTTVDS